MNAGMRGSSADGVWERARSVPPVEVASRYTTFNAAMQSPCPLCGGVDRFYFRKKSGRFGCRKCDFAGDAIELVARVENITKLQAAQRIAGVSPEVPSRAQARQAKAEPKAPAWRDPAWQNDAQTSVEAGVKALPGSIGETYLKSRGFAPETWQALRIGFDPSKYDPATKSRRPALVVPWYEPGGAIRAVKYRFCDELAKRERGRRFTQKLGSDPLLFGLHLLEAGCDLVAVEGEFNAMAVWQALRAGGVEGVGVLSIGSQSGRAWFGPLNRLATGHRLTLWMDEETELRKAAGSLPARVRLFRSPRGDDANDILLGSEATLRGLVLRTLEANDGAGPIPASTTEHGQSGHAKAGVTPPLLDSLEAMYRVAQNLRAWAAEFFGEGDPFRSLLDRLIARIRSTDLELAQRPVEALSPSSARDLENSVSEVLAEIGPTYTGWDLRSEAARVLGERL